MALPISPTQNPGKEGGREGGREGEYRNAAAPPPWPVVSPDYYISSCKFRNDADNRGGGAASYFNSLPWSRLVSSRSLARSVSARLVFRISYALPYNCHIWSLDQTRRFGCTVRHSRTMRDRRNLLEINFLCRILHIFPVNGFSSRTVLINVLQRNSPSFKDRSSEPCRRGGAAAAI